MHKTGLGDHFLSVEKNYLGRFSVPDIRQSDLFHHYYLLLFTANVVPIGL